MDKKTQSQLAESLTTDNKMGITEYLAANFSTYIGLMNLKLIAALNEQNTDGKEPAEDLVRTILEGWRDAAKEHLQEKIEAHRRMMEDPVAGLFSSVVGSAEELKKEYMEGLDQFYNQLEKTI